MRIFLAIMAVIFAIGMFAEKSESGKQNLSFGFIATMVTMSILSILE